MAHMYIYTCIKHAITLYGTNVNVYASVSQDLYMWKYMHVQHECTDQVYVMISKIMLAIALV